MLIWEIWRNYGVSIIVNSKKIVESLKILTPHFCDGVVQNAQIVTGLRSARYLNVYWTKNLMWIIAADLILRKYLLYSKNLWECIAYLSLDKLKSFKSVFCCLKCCFVLDK